MGEIVPFVFRHGQEETQIRTLRLDGKPWFVNADCCCVLGVDDNRVALRKLKPEEKGEYRIPTPGGPQQMSIINRNGLTRLVMRSDKPQALVFQDWIIEEVIPALFDYGRYEVAVTRQPDFLTAITGVQAELHGVQAELRAGFDAMAVLINKRGGFPAAVLRWVGEGVAKYEACKCIYCHEVDVVTKYGEKLDTCHEHHVNGNRADKSPENCTLPCIDCHERLNPQTRRLDRIPEHEALETAHAFHRKLRLKVRQIRSPIVTAGFWDFRIATQAEMNFPLARKKRPA